LFANQYLLDKGSFPIVLISLYHTPIKSNLLDFLGIDVLAYELLNNVIKTFASQIPLNDMYSYGFRILMHSIFWSPAKQEDLAHHHKQKHPLSITEPMNWSKLTAQVATIDCYKLKDEFINWKLILTTSSLCVHGPLPLP
jgi:hypothetical protein